MGYGKLKNFDFKKIPAFYGLSIFVNNEEKISGSKQYVLKNIEKYKELEILVIDGYFDCYVFRLEDLREW